MLNSYLTTLLDEILLKLLENHVLIAQSFHEKLIKIIDEKWLEDRYVEVFIIEFHMFNIFDIYL